MKIDLRKDRRKEYLINKKTLEVESRVDYFRRTNDEIYAVLAHVLIGIELSPKTNPDYVGLTKDEYKLFRKLDEISKRLYLECK